MFNNYNFFFLLKLNFFLFIKENFQINEGIQGSRSEANLGVRGSADQSIQFGQDSRSVIESTEYEKQRKVEIQRSDSNLTKRTSVIETETDLNPKITKELRDIYTNVNEDIEFYCEYSSRSKITDVSWYYNGKILVKQAFENKYMIRVEEGKSKLSVSRANYEDVGIYEIRIANKYGLTRSRAFLSLKKGSKIFQFQFFKIKKKILKIKLNI